MIFDLHSGAVTKGASFIDAYRAMNETRDSGKYLTRADYDLLIETKERVEAMLMHHFQVRACDTHTRASS